VHRIIDGLTLFLTGIQTLVHFDTRRVTSMSRIKRQARQAKRPVLSASQPVASGDLPNAFTRRVTPSLSSTCPPLLASTNPCYSCHPRRREETRQEESLSTADSHNLEAAAYRHTNVPTPPFHDCSNANAAILPKQARKAVSLGPMSFAPKREVSQDGASPAHV